jgi:hypothetical protein
MATAYVCDACGKTITDPYSVKMKEFNVGVEFDFDGDWPVFRSPKQRIHLCDECFHGLHWIAQNKYEQNRQS